MDNEEICGRNLLRYGKVVSDQKISGKNLVRIREIVLEGKKYLHYMVNGEVKDIVYLGGAQVHRFYFSRQQREIVRIDGFLCSAIGLEGKLYDGKKNFVLLDDGREVEYSQWCYGISDCNFPDAVLVAELEGTEKEILQRICRR